MIKISLDEFSGGEKKYEKINLGDMPVKGGLEYYDQKVFFQYLKGEKDLSPKIVFDFEMLKDGVDEEDAKEMRSLRFEDTEVLKNFILKASKCLGILKVVNGEVDMENLDYITGSIKSKVGTAFKTGVKERNEHKL